MRFPAQQSRPGAMDRLMAASARDFEQTMDRHWGLLLRPQRELERATDALPSIAAPLSEQRSADREAFTRAWFTATGVSPEDAMICHQLGPDGVDRMWMEKKKESCEPV